MGWMNSRSVLQLCARSHPKSAPSRTQQSPRAHAVCPAPARGPEGSRMESDREIRSRQPGNSNPTRNLPINLNHYATKKSVAESMLDVALFMSNAMRLKAVLEHGPSSPYYKTQLQRPGSTSGPPQASGSRGREAPGCAPHLASLPSPFCSTARLNLNEVENQWRLNQLNNAATALVFITVVFNVFITAFGAQKTGFPAARASGGPL
ncbi:ninjurin-2 [Octodon degus]|uniref:Ninjurin-2 n=1 Tax=Octodon degus TaxID=10160 RepID=A0A6P6EN09_OCTDE|nr:ninjurin-2 [Octodon degus]